MWIRVWLTGYYHRFALLRQFLMSGVVTLGAAAMLYLWVDMRGLFYIVLYGVVLCDTVAQLGGRRWQERVTARSGRFMRHGATHPAWLEHVSKGKTYGGFYLAMLATVVGVAGGLALYGGVFHFRVGVLWWLVPLVPAAAIAGDLWASYVKRGMGAGDFLLLDPERGLLGSHGGVLDRVDSHMAAFLCAACLSFL